MMTLSFVRYGAAAEHSTTHTRIVFSVPIV